MMLRRRAWLLGAAALAGCKASPSADLYTLAAVPGPERHSHRLSVELHRVGVAGYLDRPEIVRSTQEFRLHLNDADHWGEPFGGMLDRVMVENLVRRLPDAAVFAESGAISTRPDLVLEIDIQRLDADADGHMVLLAQVALRPDGKTATAATRRITVPYAAGTTQAHVAAMSAALGLLADDIADKIAAM
jgi:uncharacterized lipoprotein YmbA